MTAGATQAGPLARYCPDPRLWREGLAVGLGLDLLFATTLAVAAAGDAPDRAVASTSLLWSRPALLALGAVGALALVRFARAPGRAASGLVALVCTGLIYHVVARLSDSPAEWTLFGGIAMAGWLAGLLAARVMGHRLTDPATARTIERLAGAAAIAMLAAGYTKSGLMKLHHSGFDWLDQTTVRTAVAMHVTLDPSSIRYDIGAFFLRHPVLSQIMSLGALTMQVGAGIYVLGPRARAVWGTLFIAFHTSVFAAAAILFLTPIVLFTVFSYPWHLLHGTLDDAGATIDRPAPVVPWRRVAGLAAALVVALGITTMMPGTRDVLAEVATTGRPLDTSSPDLAALHPALSATPKVGDWDVIEVADPDRGALTIWLGAQPRGVRVTVLDDGYGAMTCALRRRNVGPFDLCVEDETPHADRMADAVAALVAPARH